ncbi:MAG: hypothetical protein AAFS00_01400, partial [Bacteroidota bacterium]
MKVYDPIFLLLCFLFCSFQYGQAQSVGIGPVGSNPDASAILDVESTSKGMLIPRMSSAQRQGIASPATGLMVYDTSTDSFWFFDGTNWTEITAGNSESLSDQDGDTHIQVEANPDDDAIRLILPGREIAQFSDAGIAWGMNEIVNPNYSGPLPASGSGLRMMWIPKLSALRVGAVSGPQWDVDSLGLNTYAIGNNHIIKGSFSGALGGLSATINGVKSGVLAGDANMVDSAAQNAAIVAGLSNYTNNLFGFIGGGANNSLENGASGSSIVGGVANNIYTLYSTISGGGGNTLGLQNASSGLDLFIGGARSSGIVDAKGSAILGGAQDSIQDGDYALILGGTYHSVSGDKNLVAAGDSSTIQGGTHNAIIGGGQNRVDSSHYAGMLGGENDTLVGAMYSVIGGGAENYLKGKGNAIQGGLGNRIDVDTAQTVGSLSNYSFIGGGIRNEVRDAQSGIIGGFSNKIFGEESGIIGGARGI